MSTYDSKAPLDRQTSSASSAKSQDRYLRDAKSSVTASRKNSQASSMLSSGSRSAEPQGMQSFYTTNLPNKAREWFYISLPLNSNEPGPQRLAALQANACVKDLGLVLLVTRNEYPRTGRPSSYDQLQPVTRRWHILDVGPVVTEVRPGVNSIQRKVISLAIHDVTYLFNDEKQAFRLPDCFDTAMRSLTIKAGRKVFERSKARAARQDLVNEDTGRWAPTSALLLVML